MSRYKWWTVVALTVLFGAGLGIVTAEEEGEPRHDQMYTCGCGPDCSCGSVSLKPGKCSCGKDLQWGHVVKIDGSDALVCQCKEGCSCSVDADDPQKCSCGKDLKKVSLKDSGIYFCNCGGSCTCNSLSSEPGKCGCGMELKKVDA